MDYIPPINGDAGDPDRPYVDADPANGVEGSIPPAAAFEDPQREILAVIDGAGLARDGADLTQLFQAIGAMIAAAGGDGVQPATTEVQGIVELATTDEAGLGTDPARVVTAQGLGAYIGKLAAAGALDLAGDLIAVRDVSTGKDVSITLNKLRSTMIPKLDGSHATGTVSATIVAAAANVNGIEVGLANVWRRGAPNYHCTLLAGAWELLRAGGDVESNGAAESAAAGPFIIPAGVALTVSCNGVAGYNLHYKLL